MTVKVGITGAAGRMGRTLIEAVAKADGMQLSVAAERADNALLGSDVGELAGQGKIGVLLMYW